MGGRILALCITVSALATMTHGAQFSVGGSASFLERLRAGHAAALAGTPTPLSVPTSSAGQIRLLVQDYHDQGGYLAMAGRAVESDKSDFIFKGDELNLYGWVVLKDRNLAWEYTTNAFGAVVVEEVPVSKVFPECDPPEDASAPIVEPAQQEAGLSRVLGPEPHIGPYSGISIRKLQSLPGAPKVLYMNINRIMNGETPLSWTKAQMWEAWQGFAAGLSMYNVNVTTDTAVYAAAGVKNAGIANMFDATGTSSCGVNAFGTTRGCTIYRKSSTTYQAGTLIHEVGHLLGLSHDGSPSGAYYGGFSTYQWCPIMGSHPTALRWTNILWQWSKGEYANANQKQDDLSLINRHLEYRADDHNAVTPLRLTGTTVSAEFNRGQIGRTTDVDTFSFQIASGGGRVKLLIDRIEFKGGSMLDIEANIYDATGKEVAHSNANAVRSASFDQALPAGKYLLTVEGGAEGSVTTGFSKYSSLGFYALQGEITGGIVTGIDPAHLEENLQVSRVGADGRAHLAIPQEAKVLGITVHSLRGDKVYESRARVGSVDLSAQPAGHYAVRISVAGASVVRRVTKLPGPTR